jgi:hypothetical protein
LSNCKCTGFLAPTNPQLGIVLINLNTTANNEYTVPNGKILFIKSGIPIDVAYLDIKAPGTNSFVQFIIGNSPYEAAVRMPSFPAGTVIRRNGNVPDQILTGYLLPNN